MVDPWKELNKKNHQISEKDRFDMAFKIYSRHFHEGFKADSLIRSEPDELNLRITVDMAFLAVDLFIDQYEKENAK